MTFFVPWALARASSYAGLGYLCCVISISVKLSPLPVKVHIENNAYLRRNSLPQI